MKKHRVFSLLLVCSAIASLGAASLAAEVVLTQNVRLYSENGKYYANLARINGRVKEFAVHKADAIDAEWSSWLDWGKGYAGYLSNDGTVFIAVNEEYSESSNLITVYYRGKQESYTVKSIPVEREHLLPRSGTYLWVDPAASRARFLYEPSGAASSFELVLLDGRVIGLELK
jgi:hypothetical protein